jgi:hypothetical protein
MFYVCSQPQENWKLIFNNYRCSMCAPRVTRHTSIQYSSSCHTRVDTGAFCLHRHPVSVNCLYHARMALSVGGSFAYFARNARCTVTTDLLVWYSNTQNDFFPGAAIFSLHTLASPSGRNVNCDEKNLLGNFFFFSCSFYLYRFRKYVSHGFSFINFYNPGVHYETPCILLLYDNDYSFNTAYGIINGYETCTYMLWSK